MSQSREVHKVYMRKYRQESSKYQAYLKEQTKKPTTKWSVWVSRLKTKYNTTPEWVGIKFIEQQGKCAICGHDIYYNVWGDLPKTAYSLHIDHDHKTLEPRGLLCQLCNTGIGSFQDNKELVFKALDYLGYS